MPRHWIEGLQSLLTKTVLSSSVELVLCVSLYTIFAWYAQEVWVPGTIETIYYPSKESAFKLHAYVSQRNVDYDLYCVPAQVAVMASIAVLVEDGNVQLLLFCFLHTVSCLVLVVFRPFANG